MRDERERRTEVLKFSDDSSDAADATPSSRRAGAAEEVAARLLKNYYYRFHLGSIRINQVGIICPLDERADGRTDADN